MAKRDHKKFAPSGVIRSLSDTGKTKGATPMKKATLATSILLFGSQANAAVPTEVTAALTGGLTDATAVAALALIIVVGVAVFKYMRRAL